MSRKTPTKRQLRDDIIPKVLRDVSIGSWLANRINRVDRAAKAGNFEEQTVQLAAVRGYTAALVHTGHFNSRQEDAIRELVEQAKNPNVACGKEYWEQHVGWAIEHYQEIEDN